MSVTEPRRLQMVAAGTQLYHLQKTAMLGAELIARHDDLQQYGGSLPYMADGKTKCVFFSKYIPNTVMASVTVDSTYSRLTATADFTVRPFTYAEKQLYALRSATMAVMKDTNFFRFCSGCDVAVIPEIEHGVRKVYIMSTPRQGAASIVFGFDYLLLFDSSNLLITRKKLHKTASQVRVDVQTNVNNNYIDTDILMAPTDICMLLLFERYTKWNQYIIGSKNYTCIWDCNNDDLQIMRTTDYQAAQRNERAWKSLWQWQWQYVH